MPQVESPPDESQQQVQHGDPVVQLLSHLTVKSNIFEDLQKAHNDPEVYAKYFKTPDLYVINNAIHIMREYDPNGKIPEGSDDHKAFITLLEWMLVKFASDPVWMCYLGWFSRFVGAHQNPNSYWPIVFHERFANPQNFFVRGEEISIPEENAKLKKPEDIFKWKDET